MSARSKPTSGVDSPGRRRPMPAGLEQGLEVDLAHLVMLAETGILAGDAARGLARQLVSLRANPSLLSGRGELYLQIESFMIEQLGPNVGGSLHIGRSRIDRGATANRLLHREGVFNLLDSLSLLRESLVNVAGNHTETVMPGYTHLQHAQPWTLAHHLTYYGERLERDHHRIESALKTINRMPLGAAALVGTAWPLDRERTRELLGFEGIVRHTRDGGSFFADYELELSCALGILGITLRHFCNELHIWHSQEFKFIELADVFCSTSSMMPQKRNPHALDLGKARAAEAIGLVGLEFARSNMVTSTDLDGVHTQSGLNRVLPSLTDTMLLLSGAVASMAVNASRCRQVAESGWSTAVALADALVRDDGLSFREAHQLVGRFVRLALDRNVAPKEATAALLVEAAQGTEWDAHLSKTDSDVRALLNVDNFLGSLCTVGSPAPKETKELCAAQRAKCAADSTRLSTLRKEVAKAKARLNEAVSLLTA